MEDESIKSISKPPFIGKFSQESRVIDLSNNPIGDAGVKDLLDFLMHTKNTIYSLTLPRVQMGISGLNSIATAIDHPNLNVQELVIGGNKFGSEGGSVLARILKSNSKLVGIDVNECALADGGIKAISSGIHEICPSTSLRWIILSKNNITSDGMKYLCDALIKNCCLDQVLLGGNDIGKGGAKHISRLIASCNSSLFQLFLGQCMICEEGCMDICRAMANNRTILKLDLRWNEVNEECIELLRKNTSVLSLSLPHRFKEMGEKIVGRNAELWREKMKWSCVLNTICRVIILGGRWEKMPLEMVHCILAFVPRDGMLREEEVRNIFHISSDIATLGEERDTFLFHVFGKVIVEVMLKLRWNLF